jgi:hypothetical protein
MIYVKKTLGRKGVESEAMNWNMNVSGTWERLEGENRCAEER